MSDLPDRILVRVDYDGTHDGTWLAVSPYEPPIEYSGMEPQYVPIARAEAAEAENEALRAALASERDRCVKTIDEYDSLKPAAGWPDDEQNGYENGQEDLRAALLDALKDPAP